MEFYKGRPGHFFAVLFWLLHSILTPNGAGYIVGLVNGKKCIVGQFVQENHIPIIGQSSPITFMVTLGQF
jgi:hypothetical protein